MGDYLVNMSNKINNPAPTFDEIKILSVGRNIKVSDDCNQFWVKIVIKKENNTQFIGNILNILTENHEYNKNDFIRLNWYNIIEVEDEKIQFDKWLNKQLGHIIQ